MGVLRTVRWSRETNAVARKGGFRLEAIGATMILVVGMSVGASFGQGTNPNGICWDAMFCESRNCEIKWVSYPASNRATKAEELFASIPSVTYVKKYFPKTAGCFGYKWDGTTCTPDGTCPNPETGAATCGSACFCIGGGEGFEVGMSKPYQPFSILGVSGPINLNLPVPNGQGYLISIPYQTPFLRAQNILTAIPNSTRVSRMICSPGGMARQTWVSTGGLPGANFTLTPGEAYMVTVSAPTTATLATNPPLQSPCPSSEYIITGSPNNIGYSWGVDTNGSGAGTPEAFDNTAPPVSSSGTSVDLMKAFVADINSKSTTTLGAQAQLPITTPTHFCVNYLAPFGSPSPVLYVGTSGSPANLNANTGAQSYNPSIVKVGAAAPVPAFHPIGVSLTAALIILAAVVLFAKRS